MKTFNASEFKARALEIMKEVLGTGQSVLVTRRGRPLVRVESAPGSPGRLQLGSLRDAMTIHADIVQPVFEEWYLLEPSGARAKQKSAR